MILINKYTLNTPLKLVKVVDMYSKNKRLTDKNMILQELLYHAQNGREITIR